MRQAFRELRWACASRGVQIEGSCSRVLQSRAPEGTVPGRDGADWRAAGKQAVALSCSLCWAAFMLLAATDARRLPPLPQAAARVCGQPGRPGIHSRRPGSCHGSFTALCRRRVPRAALRQPGRLCRGIAVPLLPFRLQDPGCPGLRRRQRCSAFYVHWLPQAGRSGAGPWPRIVASTSRMTYGAWPVV